MCRNSSEQSSGGMLHSTSGGIIESMEKFCNICYIQDQGLNTDNRSIYDSNTLHLSSRILGDPGFKDFTYGCLTSNSWSLL